MKKKDRWGEPTQIKGQKWTGKRKGARGRGGWIDTTDNPQIDKEEPELSEE